jgi:hypothetical protein
VGGEILECVPDRVDYRAGLAMWQAVVAIVGEITDTAAGKIAMERRRPPQGIYSIADLARKVGIDPKSARGRLRKHFGGTLAELGIGDWTYGPEDVDFVLNIIRPAGARPIETRERSSAEPRAPMGQATEPRLNAVDPYSWRRRARAGMALPSASGVYALFLRESSALPDTVPLDEGLIYIGLGRNLAKRCHFNGKTEGHSPRRSLAALLWKELGLHPELGANGNYKLSAVSEKRLDAWMHEHLLMAFETLEDIEVVEDALIKQLGPPLNLTKCAQSPQQKALKAKRKAMLEQARAVG